MSFIDVVRERILREAQEQQRRAQKDYEEKNNLIITMQNQLMEMQEFQKVSHEISMLQTTAITTMCTLETNAAF